MFTLLCFLLILPLVYERLAKLDCLGITLKHFGPYLLVDQLLDQLVLLLKKVLLPPQLKRLHHWRKIYLYIPIKNCNNFITSICNQIN